MIVLQDQRKSLEKDKINIEQLQQELNAIDFSKEIAENREFSQKQENNIKIVTKMLGQIKELF